MASGAVKAAMPRATGRVRLGIAAYVAMVLLAVLAIGAFFGGWALMNPAADGSGMGMPLDYLKHTPFTSYVIPGVLLFVVFGIGSVVTLLAAILRHWSAPYLTFALGVGQVIWITVELAMIQVVHPIMHPALFTLGVALAVLAYLWHRSSEQRA
jgi:hypothetical protein